MESLGESLGEFCQVALLVCEAKLIQKHNEQCRRVGGEYIVGGPKIMASTAIRLDWNNYCNLPVPDWVWIL